MTTNEWSGDLAIAPDGVVQLIVAAINRPRKRAFGVLKTQNEYVGFVRENSFEVWERQGRAVHGLGTIRGRRGGTRVELRCVLPQRTKILIGVFFALYLLVALGIATQPPRPEVSVEEIAITVAGAGLLAAIFTAAAAQQRADLRRFAEGIFSEAPRL